MIAFAKRIQATTVTTPLVGQLVRAGTSIGANYCEANNAETKKDFRHKIGICRKESHETKYWLRLVGTSESDLRTEARVLWQEAKELNLIFGAIFQRS